MLFTFPDYVGFICVRRTKIFVRVIDDVDSVFFRNQLVKCPYFFCAQIGIEIIFSLIFNDFIDSISELPTKFINFIKCVFRHKMIFTTKLFVFKFLNKMFSEELPGKKKLTVL